MTFRTELTVLIAADVTVLKDRLVFASRCARNRPEWVLYRI
jgi:hypothetical protein